MTLKLRTWRDIFSENKSLSFVLTLLIIAGIVNLYLTINIIQSSHPSFVFTNTQDGRIDLSDKTICLGDNLELNVSGLISGEWATNRYSHAIYDSTSNALIKPFPEIPLVLASYPNEIPMSFNYNLIVDLSGLPLGDYTYVLTTEQENRRTTGVYATFSIVECQ